MATAGPSTWLRSKSQLEQGDEGAEMRIKARRERSWRLRATDIICQTFGHDRAPVGDPARRDRGHGPVDYSAGQRYQHQ